jgi:hypothetical protein
MFSDNFQRFIQKRPVAMMVLIFVMYREGWVRFPLMSVIG